MHTNEQAKELWCPMVRHVSDEDDKAATNRWGNAYPTDPAGDWNSCIASKCAMWRVGYVPHRRFHKAENPLASTEAAAGAGKPACPCEFYSDWDNNGEGAGWLETEQHTQTRALGYCGLAPLHRAPGP
jgi:hypothetical protein